MTRSTQMHDKLDLEARLDIADLFSRYCHSVDSGDSEGWAALFTADGVFEVPDAIRLEGTAQLRGMPGVVAQHGGGKWRHQVTNVVAEAGPVAGTAKVRAYGMVSDWRDSGTLVSFSDYLITLRKREGNWLIEKLTAVQALDAPVTS